MRETMTALRRSRSTLPPRRATHAFIEVNFERLAKRVSRDAPAGWPNYALGLCSSQDKAEVEAFWRDRIAKYAGGERSLAEALESIDLCTRLRAAAHGDLS